MTNEYASVYVVFGSTTDQVVSNAEYVSDKDVARNSQQSLGNKCVYRIANNRKMAWCSLFTIDSDCNGWISKLYACRKHEIKDQQCLLPAFAGIFKFDAVELSWYFLSNFVVFVGKHLM